MNTEILKRLKNEKIENALKCPVCNESMETALQGSGVLFCKGIKRHCYDFSSAGYVNMAGSGKVNTGDSKQAVRARSAFLDTDAYAPIANKLCELVKKYTPQGGLVIDAGCGEGYYSNKIAQQNFSVAGFDLSKFATEAAAKRAKREQQTESTFFGVASVYSMPIFDGAADTVVNIFAPCVEDEYLRILSTGGVLIVVYAGARHLMGLKSAIYQEAHKNEARADMPKYMTELEAQRLHYSINLQSNADINNLFAMTPYYWKTSKEDFEKLKDINSLTTEIDILFSVYKKAF